MNKRTSKFLSLILSACVLSGSIFMSSCSKDDEAGPGEEFAGGTIEENKAKLEENALDFVADMKALESSEGVDAAASLASLNDLDDLFDSQDAGTGRVMTMVKSLGGLKNGSTTASDVLRSARANEEILIQDEFDEVAGTYTWNHGSQSWDISTTVTDAIIIKFPSVEGGTTNDAEFKIHGLELVNFTNTEAESSGELPTQILADLKVGGEVVVAYSYEASYKANGEPTSVTTSLEVVPFKFEVKVTNTTSDVSAQYSLTNAGANLISFGAAAKGDFSSQSLDDEDAEVNDILTSSNAFVQILDIKLEASVDNVDALYQAGLNAEDVNEEAAAMNDYTTVKFYYASNGGKIADIEFYGYEDEWDEYVDARLVFADGSKQDIATYTETGFSELETEIEELFEELGLEDEEESEEFPS